MSVNAINHASYASTPNASAAAKASEKETVKEAADNKAKESGVVYEKSSSTVNTDYVRKNSALISKLKADSDSRVSQLRGIVEQMMKKQGTAIGNADSMWRFLAGGNFTVTAAAKAQAQADIADDGYWGVEQTSDRILDFAKALSGSNPEKADELLAAFKKGFQQATKSWGSKLPDISQRTYDAVVKKFDAWKNGTEKTDDNFADEA